jgi:hypothetical protein
VASNSEPFSLPISPVISLNSVPSSVS